MHGAYKLWRLAESPEADWAELFALMYYTKYVKPICEVYGPGVWFDFFVDDWIIEKLDNIAETEISAYIKSYRSVMDFLKTFQPANLKMTITPVSSCFASREDFDMKLDKKFSTLPLPELTEAEKNMVELNVRSNKTQMEDPNWREEVWKIHNAYLAIKGETGYHKNRLDKILVFNQPLPLGTALSLGTTKSSIVKFWVGVGALKPANDVYKMLILSPSQLKSSVFEWKKWILG